MSRPDGRGPWLVTSETDRSLAQLNPRGRADYTRLQRPLTKGNRKVLDTHLLYGGGAQGQALRGTQGWYIEAWVRCISQKL